MQLLNEKFFKHFHCDRYVNQLLSDFVLYEDKKKLDPTSLPLHKCATIDELQ